MATIPIWRHSVGCLTSQGAGCAVCGSALRTATRPLLPLAPGPNNVPGALRSRLAPPRRADVGIVLCRSRGSGRSRRFMDGPPELRYGWPQYPEEPEHVTAIVAALTSLPFTQLRRNRYFYLWYDGIWAVLCITLLAAMHLGQHRGLVQKWDDRLWLLLPVAIHAQILCSVFIHNCTHNNFPRSINRLVG